MAAALEIPTEFLYAVLVKQQRVYAFSYIFTIIIAVIFLVLAIKYFKLVKYEDNDITSGTVKYLVLTLLFAFFGSILLMVGLLNLDTIMMGLINPDYGAIKEIMDFMK